MYRNREWHEFRMLASPKGPIEKLVKALMPLSRLGRIFLVSTSQIIPAFVPVEPPYNIHSARFDHTVSKLTTSNSCAMKMQTYLGLSVFYSSSE